MKEYRFFSKVIILVCLCLLFATVLNFFTGVINSTLPGSIHVLCVPIFSGVILGTEAEEKVTDQNPKTAISGGNYCLKQLTNRDLSRFC